ncbi:MAG: UvrD-helicase domain-containing protein, partial [Clostridia bacterium]|nr:UvrD-helicase domain-containing protein [Clostridia bacterium]
MAITWTDEQKAVIESVDNNTLVSASAGSGKTAVMLERVVRLIVGDGKEGQAPVPLKRIMILSFNESVAAELKSKISVQLSKLIDSGKYDREYIARQIEDIPLSDISTLHAFCGMLIKSNFEYLGIQPSYSILDDSEKQATFSKALENCLKKYRSDYDYEMDILINYFGGEKSFESTVSKIYSFLEAQLDREKFLREVALSSYSPDFKSSPLAKSFMQGFYSKCVDILADGYDKLSYFQTAGMDERANHIQTTLKFMEKLNNCKTVEELSDSLKLAPEFVRLPNTKRGDDVDKSVGADYKKFNDGYKDFVTGSKKIFERDYLQDQALIDKNRRYLERLIDLIESVSKEYARLKRKDNKMDFADLEYYAVKLLENDAIAEEISQKYDYVCLDEYQDVNDVQEYVIKRVSNGKNLFMVGDVKQSIYQFRMTDPQIFLSKYRKFKDDPSFGSPHSLNKNYRSCKEVIDFVNDVFDKIMTEEFGGIDYRGESRLSLGNTDYEEQLEPPVRITSFSKNAEQLDLPVGEDGVYGVRDSLSLTTDSSYEEGVFIAEEISKLVGKKTIQVSTKGGGMEYREVRFSDIALICSKRSSGVEKILNVLKKVGIPVDSANIVNEKSNPSVNLIIDFMRVLDNHRQDIPLVAILTCGAFSRLTYADTVVIKKEYRSEKFFFQAVEKYAKEKQDGVAEKLNEFFALIAKYRFAGEFTSVSDLIRRILSDRNYRAYALSRENGADEYSALERFISKIEGKPYDGSIAKFVEAADSVADFGKVAVDGSAQGDVVKTSTIHASKGLEYPIVFLIDIAKQVNMTDVTTSQSLCDKKYGLAIKNIDDLERSYEASLPMELMKYFKSKQIVEEFMRLFYVAATRARNRLYLTGTTPKVFGEKPVKNPKSIWGWLNNIAVEDGSFFEKYYFAPEEIDDEAGEEESRDIARRAVDEKDLRAFADMLENNYGFIEATKMPVKHTVTSVNNEYYNSLFGESKPRLADSENLVEMLKEGDDEERAQASSLADEGIAYHRVLECIDYDCYTLADVENQLENMTSQGLLTKEQRAIVDARSIFDCLQSDIIKEARKYTHYR